MFKLVHLIKISFTFNLYVETIKRSEENGKMDKRQGFNPSDTFGIRISKSGIDSHSKCTR